MNPRRRRHNKRARRLMAFWSEHRRLIELRYEVMSEALRRSQEAMADLLNREVAPEIARAFGFDPSSAPTFSFEALK